MGVGMFGVFIFLTYYLQQILGYSALESGFAFLPFTASVIAGSTVSTRFLPRVGPRILMFVGFALATAGLVLFTRLGVYTSYTTLVVPAELVMAFGIGLFFVPLSSTALGGVADHDTGVASALVNTTQQIGGALGTALLLTSPPRPRRITSLPTPRLPIRTRWPLRPLRTATPSPSPGVQSFWPSPLWPSACWSKGRNGPQPECVT
jgi:MFS family permease